MAQTKRVFALLPAVIFGTALLAGGHAHWGYTGHEGPDAWSELSPKYKVCGEGKNQSPINVVSSMDADLEALILDYQASSTEVLNNGHTVQLNFSAGSTLTVDGIVFELKQFHFHTPSENHIKGKSFPLEAHFVHLDKEGNIAVLALMFQEGKENKALAKVWEKIPEKSGEKSKLTLADIAKALLPENLDYYRFNGSLTTPPCTEGVRWLVLKTPVNVSRAQVEQFAHAMHHPNNRPIQPLNARVIVE
ncbi:MAG: carbonic anhydrase [Sulfurimonas sp.]